MGISWTMVEMLVDLDFAYDIALLLHRHWDMQEEKTNRLTVLQIQQKDWPENQQR